MVAAGSRSTQFPAVADGGHHASTPARFVCELVVFPAVLPDFCDEIADKVNDRG
jgi:hypothetical protein